MSKMGGIFQSVQEMRVNNRELNEIAESLGVPKSLIETLDDYDDDYSKYLYPYQTGNCDDNSFLC